MKRRVFIESALLSGMAAALGVPAMAAGQSDRRAGKWIIPTDTPDRFHLKVMAFNPIPAPDPQAWQLAIEGMTAQPLRLTLTDLEGLPRITQSSRLKCVQCWSGRVQWEGF